MASTVLLYTQGICTNITPFSLDIKKHKNYPLSEHIKFFQILSSSTFTNKYFLIKISSSSIFSLNNKTRKNGKCERHSYMPNFLFQQSAVELTTVDAVLTGHA